MKEKPVVCWKGLSKEAVTLTFGGQDGCTVTLTDVKFFPESGSQRRGVHKVFLNSGTVQHPFELPRQDVSYKRLTFLMHTEDGKSWNVQVDLDKGAVKVSENDFRVL